MQREGRAPPLQKAEYVSAKFFDKRKQQSVHLKARAVVLRFCCFCKVCENYRLGATGGASPSPTKAMKCCAGFAECKAKNAHRFSPYEKWEMSVQKLHN